MPSEQRPDAGQRLLGMLSAGTGPFPYRGGVYRLLGIAPRAGARMAAPMPLPPVALQYQSNAWPQPSSPPFGTAPGAPTAPPRPPTMLGTARPTNHTERAAQPPLPGRVGSARTPENPTVREALVWSPAPPAGKPAERKASTAAPVRTPPVGAGEAAPGEGTEREPVAAPAPVHTVGLAIPGLTPRSAAAPPLAKPDAGAPGATHGSTAIPGARPQRQRTAEAVSSVPSPAPGAERNGAPGVRSASPSAAPTGPDGGLLRALGPSRPRDAEETPRLRSNARALEPMEALRGASTRRAERPAPATAEPTRTEPPREAPRPAGTPAPEAPRILVVRPEPEPVRATSRSFWSASTLRSVHFRVLR